MGESNLGIVNPDISFGIYHRQSLGSRLFGEARVSVGVITGSEQTIRLIPVVYQFNYRLNSPGPAPSGDQNRISPYLYLGAGFLFHQLVEVAPPLDPRTGRLDGKLPSSSLYSFGSGITPVVPVGIGRDLPLDSNINMNLQLGYHQVLNDLNISGEEFRSRYLGITVGLNFRLEPGGYSLQHPGERSGPSPPPKAGQPVTETALPYEERAERGDTLKPELPASPFPPGLRVDTLRSGRCSYAVQIGSFSSEQSALRRVGEAGKVSGEVFRIFYNGRNGLYMVRTRSHERLSQAVERSSFLAEALQLQHPAVVHQCGAETATARPDPLQYQIQFASFGSRKNADRYAERLRDRYGIGVTVRQAEGDELYRVKSRPSSDVLESMNRLQALKEKGAGADIFLTPASKPSGPEISFRYELQAGMFRNASEAVDAVRELGKERGFLARIVVDESDMKHVILDRRITEWRELVNIKESVKSVENSGMAVIYLIQRAGGRN